MITTCLDFAALFVLFGVTIGTFVYIGLSAAEDGLGAEYVGTLAGVAAIIWACQHVVGM